MSVSVIDRVRKLLNLSQRAGSPEEAALAALRAQELIAEHRLAEADISLAGGDPVPEEAVVESVIEGDRSRRRAQQWRIKLAGALAPAFKCKIYYWTGSDRIGAIGRESDVQTLGYVQGYLALEIQRLTEEAWAGVKARATEHGEIVRELPQPSRWRNSFRLGVVSTVRERLNPKKPRPAPRHPELDDGLASAPVDPLHAAPVTPSAAQALVLASDLRAQEQVDARWKKHFPRGGRGAGWGGTTLGDGYNAGKQAGHKLDLDRRSKGAIGGSKSRIEE